MSPHTVGCDHVGPKLRDQHGQPWPWPPVAPEGSAADQANERTWLVLLPGAFTPVCTHELGWVDELRRYSVEFAASVRVIAPDSAPVLRAVAEQLEINTPLLSDFWPHGAAASALQAFDSDSGRPHRVSVLIDRHGTEHGRVTSSGGHARTLEQHLEVLRGEKKQKIR